MVPFGEIALRHVDARCRFYPVHEQCGGLCGVREESGLVGTYFIQVKYIRDYNDDIFFNDEGCVTWRALPSSGMEVGSHTIAHSKVFDQFPLGTGRESYPPTRRL